MCPHDAPAYSRPFRHYAEPAARNEHLPRADLYVCEQYLAGEKIDPKTLVPDVTVAADALLVLMQYQNKGYALLSF